MPDCAPLLAHYEETILGGNMKNFGYVLTVGGVIYLLIAFNMDVSVSTSSTYVPGYGSIGGGSVANLDLMARRQNHLIVAGLMTLIGVLLAIFGKGAEAEAEDASVKPVPALPTSFRGERDLTNDSYRLWLAKSYDIQRNDVFDKFVMDERTFDNLDDALASAHGRDEAQIQNEIEAGEAEEAARQKRERATKETKEQEYRDFEKTMGKTSLIIGTILVVVAVGLSTYFG